MSRRKARWLCVVGIVTLIGTGWCAIMLLRSRSLHKKVSHHKLVFQDVRSFDFIYKDRVRGRGAKLVFDDGPTLERLKEALTRLQQKREKIATQDAILHARRGELALTVGSFRKGVAQTARLLAFGQEVKAELGEFKALEELLEGLEEHMDELLKSCEETFGDIDEITSTLLPAELVDGEDKDVRAAWLGPKDLPAGSNETPTD